MNPNDKLNVLARIARAFNEQEITWAVGASLMLYLRGIAAEFHDIDLTVAAEDAEPAKDILSALGTLLPNENTARYRTKHFHQFIIDGVDVDLMADFTIVSGGAAHCFPMEKGEKFETISIQGEPVPLQGTAFWRECYRLMGRHAKVEMIDTWQETKEPAYDPKGI